MYPMRPYSGDFDVEPAKIVYEMFSHHCSASPNSSTNHFECDNNAKSKVEFEKLCQEKISSIDGVGARVVTPTKKKKEKQQKQKSPKCQKPRDSIEQQHELPQNLDGKLVKRLIALSSKLDNFIAKQSREEKTGQEAIVSKSVKEKPEVKVQKTKKTGTKNTDSEKVDGGLPFLLISPPANSPDFLHEKVTATVERFPIHDYGEENVKKPFIGAKIKCTLREEDKSLVRLFKQIGARRGVEFVEEEKEEALDMSKAATSGVCIEIHYGDSAGLVCDGMELFNELAVWKFIGSMLGLYSLNDTIVSSRTDKWLLEAAALLGGGENKLDALSRKMNAYLGAKDFLSSFHAICLADIVLRSRFANHGELVEWENIAAANNVQIWAKQVDIALK